MPDVNSAEIQATINANAEFLYNIQRNRRPWAPFHKLSKKEKDYWRGRAVIAEGDYPTPEMQAKRN